MLQHPIYTHLLVSENGDIYSIKTNKYLKTVIHPKGYRVFSTKLNGRKSKCVLLRVHRLVADCYITNEFNKPFVNHKDGNKLNNHYSNLEWVTNSENMQHAVKLGLIKRPTRNLNPQTKITDDLLQEIISVYKPRDRKYGLRALAKKYKVAHSTLSRLVSRWSESNRQGTSRQILLDSVFL